jgi:hypothetical protein
VTAAPTSDGLWAEVGIAPVKVALPAPPDQQRRDDGGVAGYTLRAYRPVSQVTPTEAPPTVSDDDPFGSRAGDRIGAAPDVSEAEDLGVAEPADEPEGADLAADDDAEIADEEVPLFLSHRGRLLLFSSPESLVEFARSEAPHDLQQLDEWSTVAKRVQPADVSPAQEDTYELDLVVENLRGGHDAWDVPLLIAAGEFARDVGYALRLEPVLMSMTPGSPLDDLDEALRGAAGGGLGGMLARRRLRRFGVQQASLGWRNVIGKISAAVDWRD